MVRRGSYCGRGQHGGRHSISASIPIKIPPDPVIPPMSVSENTENTSMAQSYADSASSSAVRRSRGTAKGTRIDDIVAASGLIKLTFNETTGQFQGASNSKMFTNAVGMAIRKSAPLKFKKWSDIKEEDLTNVFECLALQFRFDMSNPSINCYVYALMGKAYRNYRNHLYQHFQDFETFEEAKQHPYKDVVEEDWDYLCNLFSTEKFQKRSIVNKKNRTELPYNHFGGQKPFVFHRMSNSKDLPEGELQGPIDLFHDTHYNHKKGWANEKAKSQYETMINLKDQSTLEGLEVPSELEITQTVLGKRSGYYCGMGYGPRPPSSKRSNGQEMFAHISALQEALKFKDAQIGALVSQMTLFQNWVKQQIPNASSEPPAFSFPVPSQDPPYDLSDDPPQDL